MLTCLKLPLTFDATGLRADLGFIAPHEWSKHFNDRYFDGEWSGVALRAVDGVSTRLYSDPTSDAVAVDTPVLARCPALTKVLKTFDSPVKSARLLRLGAGAQIKEHRDRNLSLDDGEVRLHVPITTSPLVDFYLNGELIAMNPGECWYINANLPHKVLNRADDARVHLVIDCEVNEWLLSLFASAGYVRDSSNSQAEMLPSSPEAFRRFSELVFQDAGLQEKLREVSDTQLFVELVLKLGSSHGFRFNAHDVQNALKTNRRAWIERWV